jgi:hypothetical protein
MRARLEASPLLDHRGFAERYESGLPDIWEAWCRGAAPVRHITSSQIVWY